MGMTGYFIFDDIDTRNFEDVYVYFDKVDETPKRVYTKVDIPARNGAFYIDENRYEDVEHIYHIAALTKEAGSALINALASKIGYYRLEDSFNPTEFYQAVFTSGADPKITSIRDKNTFKITFTRKPQRWLKSGEEEIAIGEWGIARTISGDVVTIENEDDDIRVRELSADIEPKQDFNGYASPWCGGYKKNKIRSSHNGATVNGITFTRNDDGSYTANGTATADARLYPTALSGEMYQSLSSGNYILSGCPAGGSDATYYINAYGRNYEQARDYGGGANFNLTSDMAETMIEIKAGVTVDNLVFKPMLRLASEADSTYEPYENVCPISGTSEVKVYVSPTTSGDDATIYTSALNQTVYGGTLNVTTGLLTVDMATITLDGSETGWGYSYYGGDYANFYCGISDMQTGTSATEKGDFLCDKYEVIPHNDRSTKTGVSAYGGNSAVYFSRVPITTLESWKTYLSENPIQIVYRLETERSYNLTPQEVTALAGNNIIWANCGNITVTYASYSSSINNPTRFDSSPLLKIYGYGTVGFNGHEIELDSGQLGEISILSSGTYKMGFTTSRYTATFDESKFNAGDTITISNLKAIFDRIDAYSYEGGAYVQTYLTSLNRVSDSLSGAVSTVSLIQSSYSFHMYKVVTEFPQLTFTAGTAEQIENKVTLSGTAERGGESRTFSDQRLFLRIKYDGNGSIEFYMTDGHGSGESAYLNVHEDLYGTIETSGIAGMSTVSMLGNPTYIDCDYGEAYLLRDGTPVSLNGYVDLGSDLPTLAPGNNEVTYDDTVTELKITPRWWKI